MLLALLVGCSALKGREVVIIEKSACALECMIKKEREAGNEELAKKLEEKLEAISKETP